MVASIRMSLAVMAVALLTIPLALGQFLALKIGWPDRRLLPMVWHRLILAALGMRVHVRGRMEQRRPLLLASNHISWTDIMVLGSFADVSFIAKADMARWPVIGRLSQLQRTVFIERDRRETSAAQAGEIARRLAAGDAMVLFAEGTTADGNFLLPFKSSLFGAAKLALSGSGSEAVFVQPVAISYLKLHGMALGRRHRARVAWIGDAALVPHALALLRAGPVDVEVAFGEPVAFTASSSRKEIARLVEQRVRAMRIEAARRLHEK